MWFLYTLITVVLWTIADIYYKKGAKPNEKYSHIKIYIIVGLIFGLHAIFTLLTHKDLNYNFINIIRYLPVSICYALSMALSYYGLRYVANSISSPIEQSGGVITIILCWLVLGQRLTNIQIIGVVLIIVGVIFLTITESKEDNEDKKTYGKKLVAIALLMAFLYAILDGLGSFLDAYYLDINRTPLVNVNENTIENVANTSYELMFFISSIFMYIYMRIKGTKLGNPKQNSDKICAGITEMLGQYTYIFAMSENAIIAMPIIASTCAFQVLFSILFLHEKVNKKELCSITIVLIGIIIIGIAEALSGE